MGHGHHEPFKVPHYSIYNKWREFPELKKHSERLARLGLKDPWIRNFAFLFDPKNKMNKSSFAHLKDLFRPGFLPGLILAGTIIGIEEGYSFLKHGHTSWSNHH